MQRDELEVLTRLVQFDENLRDIAPAWEEDQDRPVAFRHLLVKVVDEVLDQINIDLVRPPHRACLQSLLAVLVATFFSRATLHRGILLDSLVGTLDVVHRNAAAVTLAAPLLAFAALASFASTLFSWAEAEPLAHILPVVILHGKHAAGYMHWLQSTVAVHLAKVLREVFCLECGTHEDYLQVLHPAIQLRLFDEQKQKVSVDVTLVHLIDDEATDAIQVRLAVETPQHDGSRGVDEACALRKLVDEADLIAHLVAKLLLPVLRHILSQRDGRDASRLSADHDLVVGNKVLRVADELRDQCGLAATSVATDDCHDVVADPSNDPILLLEGWKLLGGFADGRRNVAPRLQRLGDCLPRDESGRIGAHTRGTASTGSTKPLRLAPEECLLRHSRLGGGRWGGCWHRGDYWHQGRWHCRGGWGILPTLCEGILVGR
mmetsp:Transcript_62181/g.133703  ORF Transcript_62181/g.133703 Transcript_62181/m.133703 type:complete len:433 (+) Transcript_62181:1583-2881(+)